MNNNGTPRPSPSASATMFKENTIKTGNDGNNWIVKKNSRGIQRWVRYHGALPNTITSVKQTSMPITMADAVTTVETKQSNTKAMTKNAAKKAKEIRKIETSMVEKEEVFRMIALAESTGLPLLLVGPPGVGKTKTVLEYAKAWLNKDNNMDAQSFAEKVYILETDEGTKPSEIKGMPDLEVLFKDNKFQLSAPIADAEIVVINEVDKASSNIRNAMLGVMNEKFLFNGKHKIPCKWKLFIATCNEIPKEEVNNPFWDRFLLKMNVGRVSATQMVEYYKKGGRNYKETIDLEIPDNSEMSSVRITENKLSKYIDVAYNASSDRTLTFVPKITQAVTYIWNCSVDKALVKTAEIMVNATIGSQLQDSLVSNEMKTVMNKVDMLASYKTNDKIELALAQIEKLINDYTSNGKMDALEVEEVEDMIATVLSKHPVREQMKTISNPEAVMAQMEG